MSSVSNSKNTNKALKKMSDNQMFKELTFYVEACESGSMSLQSMMMIFSYVTIIVVVL